MEHITMYAGLGNILRRIADGMNFGSEITLGYTHYLGGQKLSEVVGVSHSTMNEWRFHLQT